MILSTLSLNSLHILSAHSISTGSFSALKVRGMNVRRISVWSLASSSSAEVGMFKWDEGGCRRWRFQRISMRMRE
jgi:hypothetical protein